MSEEIHHYWFSNEYNYISVRGQKENHGGSFRFISLQRFFPIKSHLRDIKHAESFDKY